MKTRMTPEKSLSASHAQCPQEDGASLPGERLDDLLFGDEDVTLAGEHVVLARGGLPEDEH